MEAMRKIVQNSPQEHADEVPARKIEASNDNEGVQPISTVEPVFANDNELEIRATEQVQLEEVKERLGITSLDENVLEIPEESLELALEQSVAEEGAGDGDADVEILPLPIQAAGATTGGRGAETKGTGGSGTSIETGGGKKKGILWGLIKGVGFLVGGLIALSINGIRAASDKILTARGKGGGGGSAKKPAGGDHH